MSEEQTLFEPQGPQDKPGCLQPGDVVGDFVIQRLLGRGGMGEVYLAEHRNLQVHYALKVLPPELSKSEGFRRRFGSEARTVAQLDHPHIVRVTYAGEHGALSYLVMEYVGGGDLEAYLKARGGQIEPARVRDLLAQILSGLAYAHTHRVVHRDLKPANLLMTQQGGVKISDFGLAQVVGDDYLQSLVERSLALSQIAGAETLQLENPSVDTTAAAFVGTIDYMSPEAREGRAAGPAGDLFAVGVIAYYLLTGRKPVGMARPASALVRSLSPRWDKWLSRALQPDPADRFPDAQAMLQALPPARRTRVPMRALGAAAGLLLLAGGVTAGLLLTQRAASETPAEQNAPVSAATPEAPPASPPAEPPEPAGARPDPAVPAATAQSDPSRPQPAAEAPAATADTPDTSARRWGFLATEPDARYTVLDADGDVVAGGSTDARGRASFTLLDAGSYRLRVEKAGYHPQERRSLSAQDLAGGLRLPLEARAPELRLDSQPSGAEVFVNGQRRGRTPVTLAFATPEAAPDIELRAQGFHPLTQTLSAEQLKRDALLLELEPLRGEIELRTLPLSFLRRAQVSIDGAVMQLEGNTVQGVPSGSHTLRIDHPDYLPYAVEVEVVADETTRHLPILQLRPGYLQLAGGWTADRVEVLVEGEALEADNQGRFALNAYRDYRVELREPGYETQQADFKVRPGQVLTWAPDRIQRLTTEQRRVLARLEARKRFLSQRSFTPGTAQDQVDELRAFGERYADLFGDRPELNERIEELEALIWRRTRAR